MHFPGDAASIPNRSPVPQLAVEFGRVLLVAVIAVDVSVVTVSAETGVARSLPRATCSAPEILKQKKRLKNSISTTRATVKPRIRAMSS